MIIKSYADSAARVKEAGFDGVELHGGTGYLLVPVPFPANELEKRRLRRFARKQNEVSPESSRSSNEKRG